MATSNPINNAVPVPQTPVMNPCQKVGANFVADTAVIVALKAMSPVNQPDCCCNDNWCQRERCNCFPDRKVIIVDCLSSYYRPQFIFLNYTTGLSVPQCLPRTHNFGAYSEVYTPA
jgi:hypothetical protein